MKAHALVRNVPMSARKLRLLVDAIRSHRVSRVLTWLKFQPTPHARYIEKLLLSVLSNWVNKHEGANVEEADIYVSKICVEGGRMLKRFRPVPHGRAHRIRKRSAHIRVEVEARNIPEAAQPSAAAAEKASSTQVEVSSSAQKEASVAGAEKKSQVKKKGTKT